jgi:hypothetical protein
MEPYLLSFSSCDHRVLSPENCCDTLPHSKSGIDEKIDFSDNRLEDEVIDGKLISQDLLQLNQRREHEL